VTLKLDHEKFIRQIGPSRTTKETDSPSQPAPGVAPTTPTRYPPVESHAGVGHEDPNHSPFLDHIITMAANSSRSAAFALSRRAAQQCSSSSRPAFPLKRTARAFTTTPTTAQTDSATKIDEISRRTLESERHGDLKETRPRWSYTPEGMKAPFSPHVVKDPSRKIWKVNSDPVKLDQMYLRLLGKGGDKLLPEEIKWLAITHKSFDQGRRGFNDRLAFLGTSQPLGLLVYTMVHLLTN
jgi:hypothetical protein